MSHPSNLMESCLRTILSTSNDLLLLLDDQLRIVTGTKELIQQWFPAASSAQSLRGLSLSEALEGAVPEPWLLRTEQTMEKVLQEDHASRYSDDVLLLDGRTMFLQIAMEPLSTSDSDKKGLLLSFRDTTDLLQIKRREDLAKVSHTTFLANMTHAIRTPMNHIMGISHLLSTSQQLDPVGRSYVTQLMRSANSLMDTLTNILRYSDTGKPDFDIVEDSYSLAGLIEDISVFAQMRAEDKHLAFITDVDPDLPSELIGDEAHIKQIIVNLLAGAIQYTNHGYVKLSFSQIRMGNSIDLMIKVSDTGMGFEKEEIARLFAANPENAASGQDDLGTGLPMARSLARAMEGDLEVDSHVGKGTSFTFTVPQIVSESHPVAALSRPEKRLVLLYGESITADSAETMLIRLSVPYRRVNRNTLPLVLERAGRYTHIIYQNKDREEVAPALQTVFEASPFFKALVITGVSEADRPEQNAQTLILSEPVLISHLSAALAGDSADREEKRERVGHGENLLLQNTRILVVDDSEINALVAAEILRQMEADVDTALSGQETLNLCAQNQYDIIFMDHLMPVMDGIETTARLRAMGGYWKTAPIVALTANVVVGVRQMYLSAGMSGFIPKPIELPLLREVLREFLPAEKMQEASGERTPKQPPGHTLLSALQDIRHLRPEEVISKTGSGTYLAILKTFIQVAPEKIGQLEKFASEANWDRFRIEIHGQKSSLFNIGSPDLSAEARAMEIMASAGDTDPIPERLDSFIRHLHVLCKSIQKALDSLPPQKDDSQTPQEGDRNELFAALWRISGHVECLEIDSAEKELVPLLQLQFSKRIRASLNALRDALSAFDYKSAQRIIADLQKKENKDG